ncbi:hypothetical protein D3C80_1824670 [compost metagenome]
MLFLGEHVHGAALTLGQTTTTTGQFGHNTTGTHASCQHVAMVTISGDNLIAFLLRHLHADNNSFLTDVQVTEPADEAHAVKLASLFFESANQQHFTVGVKFLVLAKFSCIFSGEVLCGGFRRRLTAGYGRGFTWRP